MEVAASPASDGRVANPARARFPARVQIRARAPSPRVSVSVSVSVSVCASRRHVAVNFGRRPKALKAAWRSTSGRDCTPACRCAWARNRARLPPTRLDRARPRPGGTARVPPCSSGCAGPSWEETPGSPSRGGRPNAARTGGRRARRSGPLASGHESSQRTTAAVGRRCQRSPDEPLVCGAMTHLSRSSVFDRLFLSQRAIPGELLFPGSVGPSP